jgi:DNA-binding CsgD family transcriptional regulator
MPGAFSSRVFVGRQRELGELRAAYERAAVGAACAMLVGGEAGVGKTRLLAELGSGAQRDGALVLTGVCADLRDAAMPLLAIAEALAALGPLPGRASADLEDAGRGVAPGVAVFAPVLELLREAAADAPVLLAIDDVHWADRSTLDLLTFLLARIRDERLLLVLTFRSDEIDRRAELRAFVAEAGRRPIARRIELERLTRDELDAQLEGILGRAPEPRVADAVFARSAGNPLFAEELIETVAHGGTGELPATLRDVLLARIMALGAPAQAVVRAAAVGGLRIHHELLAATAALDEPQLGEAIREAVLHHVLVADGDALAFRHPLLQEAAYAELLPGERARLHASCARALEAQPRLVDETAAIAAAEIADHWWRAGDRARAFEAAAQAGSEAQRVNAHAEAAEHLGRALELWDAVDDPERRAGQDHAELLASAAQSTSWSGSPARGVELASAALELVDAASEPVRAARLHERRGIYLWWEGRGADAISDYEEAVRIMPAAPPSTDRAHVLAGLGFILMLMGQTGRSREVCEQALEVARATGARAAEGHALATLGNDLDFLGDRTAGIACLREARALAREVGAPELLAQTAIGLSDALRMDGSLEEAVAVGLEGAQESIRTGLSASQGAFSALNAAEAAYELGHWELVEEVCGDVLADLASEIAVWHAHLLLGLLAVARRDFAEAHDRLQLVAEHVGPAAQARALADPLESPHMATRAAALGARAAADVAEIARARGDQAEVRAACEEARAFRDLLVPGRDENRAREAAIAAELGRADGQSDPARWEAAALEWDARHTPLQAAYAGWRWAEALLAEGGGRGAAAAALRASRETASGLGAQTLLDEVDALARRARIDLTAREERAPSAPLPDAAAELGLTPRELEVLEHLARGQTNREIAAELFISARTAGVHVSHILEKLGASTRTEAAAAAHRLRLVP